MSCSCQTTALRIFVRSVVRTHTPSFAPSRGSPALAQPLRPSAPGSKTPFAVSSFHRSLTTTTPRRTGEDGKAEDETPNVPTSEPAKPKRTLKDKKREQKAAAKAAPEPTIRTTKAEPEAEDEEKVHTPPKEAVYSKGADPGPLDEGYPFAPAVRQKRVLKLKQHEPPNQAPSEPPPKKEHWQLQKTALEKKFPEGWSPRKKLSPDALAGIRALHQQFPEEYTTEVLANKFEVSAEAVRRILKSKWEPNADEEIERQDRWFSRGKRIWTQWAELGKKPPERWRKEGITRTPEYHEQRRARAKARSRLSRTLL